MRRLAQFLKKYLIPHEGNGHRPHLLRPRTVLFVCLVAIGIQSVYLFGTNYIVPRSKLFGIIVANVLIDGTNQARLTQNLPALKESPLLDLAAQAKANDMAANHYFAHTSPSGLSPWHWFDKAGYGFIYAGENLAVDFSDSQDVTSAWLNSPSHRANILNSEYTEIGMATAQGEFNGHPAIFVVEEFGKPAPMVALAPTTAPAARLAPTVLVPRITVAQVGPAVPAAPEPISVAVKGAESQVPDIAEPEAASATAAAQKPVFQASPLQAAAAEPRRMVDYVYLTLVIFFAAALLINIFVKIKIQHPQVILGGMLVVLLAGLLLVLNQHSSGAGAVIL